MASFFYLVSVLNAMFGIMCILLIVAGGIFVGLTVSNALDSNDSFTGEKEKKVENKAKKLSGILALIAVLWVLFVPSGDTYLKMKVADKIGEDRIEYILDVIENDILETLDNYDNIEYD